MPIASTLTTLLIEAAKLMATSAAGDFAKAAGKSAFEAIKSRLTTEHKAEAAVALIDKAAENDAYRPALEADLTSPHIDADETLVSLTIDLQKALEAMPASPAYAIDTDAIRVGGNLLMEQIEGIRAGTITAEGDATFSGIKAPGK